MKLAENLDRFLIDVVNLDETRLGLLDQHLAAIGSFLGGASGLQQRFRGLIRQGSLAHRTIIRPLEGKQFDADVLAEVPEVRGWRPAQYLAELEAAFERSTLYKPKVILKDRCIRIDYAGDEHIDVVPWVGGCIVNRKTDQFEPTDPQAFTAWMQARDTLANGHLRRVIRLVKYLRDYKETFSVKSVLLTTLLGEQVRAARQNSYSDVPTALLTILQDLAAYLEGFPVSPPSVRDPSGGGRTFDHRWDRSRYPAFHAGILRYAKQVADAYNEPDRNRSVALWQDVFGPDYKSSTVVAKFAQPSGRPRDPGEEFLDEKYGISYRPEQGVNVAVDCTVRPSHGFRAGSLSSMGGRVQRDRHLEFSASVRGVGSPYDVYWKIKNSGQEAGAARDLRGQIYPDAGRLTRSEHTLYRGEHYVECYLVKGGRCLARHRYPVRIV